MRKKDIKKRTCEKCEKVATHKLVFFRGKNICGSCLNDYDNSDLTVENYVAGEYGERGDTELHRPAGYSQRIS